MWCGKTNPPIMESGTLVVTKVPLLCWVEPVKIRLRVLIMDTFLTAPMAN